MPSAARQRLPADLWRQGQRKHSSGSPVQIFHSHEIQASPGHYDVFQEDKQHNRQGSKKQTHRVSRKQYHATGRRSPKSLPRRGSSDTLSTVHSDSDSAGCDSDSSTAVLSSSAKSDSCLSQNPSQATDAYAMEAAIAPHPSQLPFPPLEWLQASTKRSGSPAIDGMSLQAILGCLVAA